MAENKLMDAKKIDEEIEEISRFISPEQDPILIILRGHLLSEHYLERVILAQLPRGDKIIGKANLTYAQKLHLVDSLDVLPNRDIHILRNLNAVRNSLSHNKDHQVCISDIDKIGNPLGRGFTKIKNEHGNDLKKLLFNVFAYLFTVLVDVVFKLEVEEIGGPSNTNKDSP